MTPENEQLKARAEAAKNANSLAAKEYRAFNTYATPERILALICWDNRDKHQRTCNNGIYPHISGGEMTTNTTQQADLQQTLSFANLLGVRARVCEDSVQFEAATRLHNTAKALEAALAECERLRADAERYRWLRNDAQNDTSESAPLVFDCTCDGGVRFTLTEVSLDAAIDAARAKP